MGRNFVSLLASVFRRFYGGQQKSFHRCVQIGTDCKRIGASQERSRFQICSHFTIIFDTEENPIPWWLRSPPWPAWNLLVFLVKPVNWRRFGDVGGPGKRIAWTQSGLPFRVQFSASTFRGRRQSFLPSWIPTFSPKILTDKIQALSLGTVPAWS